MGKKSLKLPLEEHEWVCFDSPGDAAVVKPLLSPHDDVESAAEVVWLHIHDLMMTGGGIINKPFLRGFFCCDTSE